MSPIQEAWRAVFSHEAECTRCAPFAEAGEVTGVCAYEDHCAEGQRLLDAAWDLEEGS